MLSPRKYMRSLLLVASCWLLVAIAWMQRGKRALYLLSRTYLRLEVRLIHLPPLPAVQYLLSTHTPDAASVSSNLIFIPLTLSPSSSCSRQHVCRYYDSKDAGHALPDREYGCGQ